MNLNELTPEQRAQLAKEALEAEKAKEKQKENDKQAYKELVSNKVDELFPTLEKISTRLGEAKKQVYEEFSTALSMKRELYKVKESQNSHAFMNAEGNRRITLGNNTIDNYDDTVDAGISIVKEYISSLAKDDNSRILVDTVMRLLAKDQKGTLKPSRVMQLRQMADKSGDSRFIEGVRTIEAAYKPITSKTYVRAEVKDENGTWRSIPLGMTEA
ncbi:MULTISPECIES: DUF3164 family protein [Butyricimonas]|uniref:DUF3164 family protein n=1 Tax=Butyricimonas TaxID=574697 RepID=UPI001D07A5CE|nr:MULTISPECIES: DUF3164 family protein [Butyricimonas]MCB6971845.1 DUF3164 family protein [Butyricimonas synergistica]MCG4518853.1 DUF3164 family protein [Butyricimonas sp. DFI.6.44]